MKHNGRLCWKTHFSSTTTSIHDIRTTLQIYSFNQSFLNEFLLQIKKLKSSNILVVVVQAETYSQVFYVTFRRNCKAESNTKRKGKQNRRLPIKSDKEVAPFFCWFEMCKRKFFAVKTLKIAAKLWIVFASSAARASFTVCQTDGKLYGITCTTGTPKIRKISFHLIQLFRNISLLPSNLPWNKKIWFQIWFQMVSWIFL